MNEWEFAGNNIGDEGVKIVSKSVKENSFLTELHIDCNNGCKEYCDGIKKRKDHV